MIKIKILSISALVISGLLLIHTNFVRANEINIDVKQSIKSEKTLSVSNTTVVKTSTSSGENYRNTIEEKRAEINQKREDIKENLDNKISSKSTEIREKLASRTAEIKARLTENVRFKVKNIYQVVIKRFETAILRLEKLNNRIKVRLQSLKSNKNINTTKIENDIANIETNIGLVKDQVESLSKEIDTVLESEDPKTMFSSLRENIKEVHGKIIEIFQDIQDLIPEIEKLHTQLGVDLNDSSEMIVPQATQ